MYLYTITKVEHIFLDFVIDDITDCIVNSLTGEIIQTEVTLVNKVDLKEVLIKNGWLFNWNKLYREKDDEFFYKLTVQDDLKVQGLIKLSIESDHIFMHLIESAPENRGDDKIYRGVAGNLVAFICKLSFDLGYEGCVAFRAKTDLISHYEESLGAIHLGNHRMIIITEHAQFLVNKYFKS